MTQPQNPSTAILLAWGWCEILMNVVADSEPPSLSLLFYRNSGDFVAATQDDMNPTPFIVPNSPSGHENEHGDFWTHLISTFVLK